MREKVIISDRINQSDQSRVCLDTESEESDEKTSYEWFDSGDNGRDCRGMHQTEIDLTRKDD